MSAETTETRGDPSGWGGKCGYCGFTTEAVACPRCGLWSGREYRTTPVQQPTIAAAAVLALNNERIRRAVAAADPERSGTASLEEAFDAHGVEDGPDAQAVLRLWSGGRRRSVAGWRP